jgi:hypothetical protein
MRVLFDQATPVPIRSYLIGHEVRTAAQQGWDTLQNGELLLAADAAGFEVLLTTDKNMLYQQNLAGRKIAVVILGRQQWPGLQPYIHLVVDDAINYALNQWAELTVFCSDGAVPMDNNVSEREMKRIILHRKNSLFVGNPRGGRTAAILASLTSTCRRHEVDPQLYLTQLLMNLPQAKMSELSDWLPDQWKIRHLARIATLSRPSAGN